MSMSLDVSEFLDLGSDMQRNAGLVEPKAELIVAKTAFDITALAQVLAPFEFGTLKESIGADIDGLSAEIGPTVDYGLYQELGTSEMSPQPFLAPAFDQHEDGFVDAIGDLGEQAMAR